MGGPVAADHVVEDPRALSLDRARPAPVSKPIGERLLPDVAVDVSVALPSSIGTIEANGCAGEWRNRVPVVPAREVQSQRRSRSYVGTNHDLAFDSLRNRNSPFSNADPQSFAVPPDLTRSDDEPICRSLQYKSAALRHRPALSAAPVKRDIQ